MNTLETRVAELVQTYPHLYDRSRRDFRDSGMSWNSWKEIAVKLGVDDPKLCRATWKNIRDKFGKAMKRMKCKNADEASSTKVPRLFLEMSWLKPYVRHRQTVSSMASDKKVQTDTPSKEMVGDVLSSCTAPSACPSSGATSDSDTEEQRSSMFLDGFGEVLERSSTARKAARSYEIMSTLSSTPEPPNRRKRKRDNADETDIKQVLAFLEKDKSDSFDRHAQIVADFMRKLPPRHCAVFKKRLQDVMFDIEMQVLEEQGIKTTQ
ncbi:transcription factor Adf-1-like [Myxocyprinus asiaticus]|uniref:transcription factor Adf-1-like n=1 Tax=Myxocyprinus asiaticus TaxID=70543 RepID=UPI0022231135|nr:transcription factor Adf-1-like [Myxocyprinus asiaticus]